LNTAHPEDTPPVVALGMVEASPKGLWQKLGEIWGNGTRQEEISLGTHKIKLKGMFYWYEC